MFKRKLNICLALIFLVACSLGVFAKGQNIEVVNGMTQPVFGYANAIRETVWVEAPMDSDGDGSLDRIRVQIVRPRVIEEGLKVPVIYEMSPYSFGWVLNWATIKHDPWADLTPVKGPFSGWSGPFDRWYDNYFVPMGYAVVLADAVGTGQSTGTVNKGGKIEVIAIKAVIDWLNGRVKAYNANGEEVVADWSTGNVGMIGGSAAGTYAIAAAANGVEGLKTIVPIRAISSYYDYYRANGLAITLEGYVGYDIDLSGMCNLRADALPYSRDALEQMGRDADFISGDYNEFWDERNYLKDAKNVTASVFVIHGLNDWNVKTKQFAQWWEAMEEYNVPRKLWLHQGGHDDPFKFNTIKYLETIHKWFDYWLYDIDNDIMDEPMVLIQRENLEWVEYENWPDPDSEKATIYFEASEDGKSGSLRSKSIPSSIRESFIDDRRKTVEFLVSDPDKNEWYSPKAGKDNRLVYLSPVLTEDIRMSGTPIISVKASIDRPVAILTALLVDYGKDKRPTIKREIVVSNYQYGAGIPGDTGETNIETFSTATEPYRIVTRGWMDPQNRNSVSHSEPITPGEEYTFTWDMQPHDYVFKTGHQIGVVIMSTDYEFTLRPTPGTKITVTPSLSHIELPIIGGSSVLDW